MVNSRWSSSHNFRYPDFEPSSLAKEIHDQISAKAHELVAQADEKAIRHHMKLQGITEEDVRQNPGKYEILRRGHEVVPKGKFDEGTWQLVYESNIVGIQKAELELDYQI